MTPVKQVSSDLAFSQEAINSQLLKMLTDPVFEHSDILRRFLSFIVEEALNGHSNQLKEYTIAVKILNKPGNFNPQENGIVRIHAGRLRRSLELYYNTAGVHDPIRISIPKGNYVPVFSDNNSEELLFDNSMDFEKTYAGNSHLMVAVIPFGRTCRDEMVSSLAEGIGLQLSASLMSVNQFSVVAYYTTRKLSDKFQDIRTIGRLVGAHYVITGDVQSNADSMRIHLQMLRTNNNQLVWSRMYERRINHKNIFGIQDEIVKEASAEIALIGSGQKKGKIGSLSLVAVA